MSCNICIEELNVKGFILEAIIFSSLAYTSWGSSFASDPAGEMPKRRNFPPWRNHWTPSSKVFGSPVQSITISNPQSSSPSCFAFLASEIRISGWTIWKPKSSLCAIFWRPFKSSVTTTSLNPLKCSILMNNNPILPAPQTKISASGLIGCKRFQPCTTQDIGSSNKPSSNDNWWGKGMAFLAGRRQYCAQPPFRLIPMVAFTPSNLQKCGCPLVQLSHIPQLVFGLTTTLKKKKKKKNSWDFIMIKDAAIVLDDSKKLT